MSNAENPWLWEEQKKLTAEAFTARWKPRIIPWIRTYNLQQLPPSDRPKWLSAAHRAQLIAAMNLEPGQYAATAQRTHCLRWPASLSLQPWPEPSPLWWALTLQNTMPRSPCYCHNNSKNSTGRGLKHSLSTDTLQLLETGLSPMHHGKSILRPFVNS